MKTIKFIGGIILCLWVFQACSSDDKILNSEADILSAAIQNGADLLDEPPVITDNKVTFRLKNTPEDYFFAPEFVLSDGASINPHNGIEMDFAEPHTYVVTSEDQNFTKTYTVHFVSVAGEDSPEPFSFENASIHEDGKYHEFFELNTAGQAIYNWGTGNPGFSVTLAITGQELAPEAYPTYQISNGFQGKAVQMQTKSTGELGAAFGAPLAAGNLFLGEFVEITQPDPRQGVHFGRTYPYAAAPAEIKGYFKYERGEDFQVNNEEGSVLTEDGWNAYAILFERSNQENYLKGDFSPNDPRIVAKAFLDDNQRVEAEEWTAFSIPFEWVQGKSFDPDQEYMYTIVFSASMEGDLFNGAVGSRLQIDEVELILE